MDVITNGPPPRRPLPRWLGRVGLTAVVVGGVAVAYAQQDHHAPAVTAPPAPAHATRSAAAPAPVIDQRPLAHTTGLRDRVLGRLSATDVGPVRTTEVVGSAYRDGRQSLGIPESMAVPPGDVRLDLVCEGTGSLVIQLQDAGDGSPGYPTVTLDCGHGQQASSGLALSHHNFFVYVQLEPATVGVLGYAIHAVPDSAPAA